MREAGSIKSNWNPKHVNFGFECIYYQQGHRVENAQVGKGIS